MVSQSSLISVLGNSVVELKFNRRRPKVGVPPHRRMLCTLDYNILNSENGLKILNYKQPAGSVNYNFTDKGLVSVWDILKQDWRMVNIESCRIISTIPTSPADIFWEYFYNNIQQMSAGQKAAFINT